MRGSGVEWKKAKWRAVGYGRLAKDSIEYSRMEWGRVERGGTD